MSGNLTPHLITLQSKTTDADAAGGQAPSYADSYANVAALVAPASSSRLMFYDRRNIQITHSIYTETSITVNIGDIVLFGTRRFSVKGFMNVLEGGRLYQIDAEEILTTGEVYQK